MAFPIRAFIRMVSDSYMKFVPLTSLQRYGGAPESGCNLRTEPQK